METLFVRFIVAETTDQIEYKDERMKYKKKSGLLVLVDGKREGSKRAIFHTLDENGRVSTISTSSGKIMENDDCLSIKTSHSIYIFGKEYSLSAEEKAKLTDYVNRD